MCRNRGWMLARCPLIDQSRITMTLLLPFLFAASLMQGGDSVDILVRGGTVYDGSGSPGRVTDVGIRGDRIVLVGDGSRLRAGRVLDARGLIVAPGFIDPHTHSLAGVPDVSEEGRRNAAALMQGVTTVTISP